MLRIFLKAFTLDKKKFVYTLGRYNRNEKIHRNFYIQTSSISYHYVYDTIYSLINAHKIMV